MKRLYVIITCQILALLLFLSAHFLVAIYANYQENIFFGLLINALLIEICFFIAIGLQILSILLLISLELNKK